MIRKKTVGLCILAVLSIVSCKKNESKIGKSKTDSSVISRPADKVLHSVQPKDAADSDDSQQVTEIEDPKTTVSKNAIEGKFVANTCNGDRFSIELKNTDGKPTFKILDKGKVIAAGNVSTETDEKTGKITTLTMGEIGGLYQDDKIIVQNYGNAMNEFDHFTQCGDKYLEFTKSR